ncbi:Gram-negative bacterial tonB protein [compost metagenome]
MEQAIRSLGPAAMVNLGNRDWITNVEFLLDSDGNVKKALIMKESGVVAFDTSAVRAFQEAAVFPNPPQEMIQEDGFIHLKFSFTVNFRPPTLVNSN